MPLPDLAAKPGLSRRPRKAPAEPARAPAGAGGASAAPPASGSGAGVGAEPVPALARNSFAAAAPPASAGVGATGPGLPPASAVTAPGQGEPGSGLTAATGKAGGGGAVPPAAAASVANAGKQVRRAQVQGDPAIVSSQSRNARVTERGLCTSEHSGKSAERRNHLCASCRAVLLLTINYLQVWHFSHRH